MKIATLVTARLSQARAAINHKTTSWFVAASVGTFGMAGQALAITLDMSNVAATAGLGSFQTAIQQFANMNTGAKALVIIIAFLVALIGLAALRNFAPVIGFIGVALFAAVGLGVGFAIAGAMI